MAPQKQRKPRTRTPDLERGKSDEEGGRGGMGDHDKTGGVKREGSAVVGRTWPDMLVKCVRSAEAVVDGFWWVEVAVAIAIVVVALAVGIGGVIAVQKWDGRLDWMATIFNSTRSGGK
ncbi:hypothetical protein B0T24DRAFT_591470 [Lasiosphaeria ovina]|uniref:Uncharacterized protein n=1 Tax=Lasiosphaeria ovina TaxID=92902 RepID=A0AAE0KFF3_9PEZI|nr:hypothetical protein B0T24DRAFT_591470 [Lasiosphaeria ovina]